MQGRGLELVAEVDATLFTYGQRTVDLEAPGPLDLSRRVSDLDGCSLMIDLCAEGGDGTRSAAQPAEVHSEKLTPAGLQIRPDPVHDTDLLTIGIQHLETVKAIRL